MPSDLEIAPEMALATAKEITGRITRRLLPGDPEGAASLAGEYAQAFLAAPDDKNAAAIRRRVLVMATALNPQTPEDHPVWGVLQEMGLPAEMLRQQAMIDDEGRPYTGGGWTESEKQGRAPGAWELSPGDFVAYQRQLDLDTLASIAEGRRLLHNAEFAPEAFGGRSYARNFANGELLKAVQSYDGSRGNRQASGLFGSTYPQHQGGNAIRDALSSNSSPIGNYLQGGQFTADAAAHLLMSPGVDPANQAAVTHEGRYQWERPSPHFVPEGLTPEGRDQYIARGRQLIQETMPPNYSLSYMREHGEPPSYVGQGLASVANFFADFSLPAMFGAGKAVNATAKGLAKTGLPVLSQYGRHIASKTAPIAAATPAAFATREGMEDGVFASGIQGITTAAQDDRPSFFFPGLRGLPSAWKSGMENRPDIRAALLAEGVRVDADQTPSRAQMLSGKGSQAEYFAPGGGYDQKIKRSEEAAKELASMNRQSPESFDKSSTIGQAGSAVGDFAGQLLDHMPAPPKEQPKYLPPAWGPWGFR